MRRFTLFLLLIPCILHAQQFFDAGQPGPLSNANNLSYPYGIAANFTVSQNVLITGASIYIEEDGYSQQTGARGVFDWALYADNGDALPGQQLTSGSTTPWDAGINLWSISLPYLEIHADTRYWLSLSDPEATGAWWRTALSDTALVAPLAYADAQGNWASSAAVDEWYESYGNRLTLQLEGAPTPDGWGAVQPQSFARFAVLTTPEPSSLGLMALGLVGLVPVIKRTYA